MVSRIPGFYKLTPNQRLKVMAEKVNLTKEEKLLIGGEGLRIRHADQMIENVIGVLPVPLGIAVNFKVDEEDVFIPMATEEASVVAAASHAAKLTYDQGGFTTSYTGSIMRGQIQLIQVKQPYHIMAKIYEKKQEIISLCNQLDQTLVKLGGGAKNIEVTVFDEYNMIVVHVIVDTKDAMGANAVNTMIEGVTPFIEEISKEKVGIRIISNLADQRIVRARASFKNPLSKMETDKFIDAYNLATIDPYRATTHNKGIMNGITAVALATGNDTRAIEAGAHAFASQGGSYSTLTHWETDQDNNIVGTIEVPLAVGIVGGATYSNPIAKTAIKIMNAGSAERLARIMAAVGLAQNFAALRALVTDGIQKGHMKLHAQNLAIMAGASANEIDLVVQKAKESNVISFGKIKEIVESLKRNNNNN